MADDFGLRIGVESEREFKKALRDINQSFKVFSRGSPRKRYQAHWSFYRRRPARSQRGLVTPTRT